MHPIVQKVLDDLGVDIPAASKSFDIGGHRWTMAPLMDRGAMWATTHAIEDVMHDLGRAPTAPERWSYILRANVAASVTHIDGIPVTIVFGDRKKRTIDPPADAPDTEPLVVMEDVSVSETEAAAACYALFKDKLNPQVHHELNVRYTTFVAPALDVDVGDDYGTYVCANAQCANQGYSFADDDGTYYCKYCGVQMATTNEARPQDGAPANVNLDGAEVSAPLAPSSEEFLASDSESSQPSSSESSPPTPDSSE